MPISPYIAALRQKIGHDLLLVPTVVVIVRNDKGQLLLVHDRDADCWTLPGGIMEPGETPAEAAVREVQEETQLHVQLTKLVGVLGGPGCETHYRNGDKIAWVATVFLAQSGAQIPSPDDQEVTDARFVDDESLPALRLRDDARRFLQLEQAPMSEQVTTPNRLAPALPAPCTNKLITPEHP
jgi:ADP-ribose pyrophosphatase YjhB (NUDIX family)